MKGRLVAALALVAAALAARVAPAAESPTLSIPGTALSLGMRITRVDSLMAFRVSGRPALAARRNGITRFFGLDATTVLDFESGRLARAHFEIKDVSTHSRDYVEDQLRRSGLRVTNERREATHHEGDWTGECLLHVQWDTGTLSADAKAPDGFLASLADSAGAAPAATVTGQAAGSVTAQAAGSAAAPAGAAAPATSGIPALAPTAPVVTTSGTKPATAALTGGATAAVAIAPVGAATAAVTVATIPDTLFIGWPIEQARTHRARTQVPPPDPIYPEAARRAGVQGVVRLIATVNARGTVSHTEIVHSIPELDRAATDAARACRFVPLGPPGVPQGFRVLVKVRFTR